MISFTITKLRVIISQLDLVTIDTAIDHCLIDIWLEIEYRKYR
jgi:hypothetical protein